MRARHQLLDAPVILKDPVVLNLVPEARDPGVLSEFGDSSQPVPILLRSLFAMRSRFTRTGWRKQQRQPTAWRDMKYLS
jgi:hypothetical protein